MFHIPYFNVISIHAIALLLVIPNINLLISAELEIEKPHFTIEVPYCNVIFTDAIALLLE